MDPPSKIVGDSGFVTHVPHYMNHRQHRIAIPLLHHVQLPFCQIPSQEFSILDSGVRLLSCAILVP